MKSLINRICVMFIIMMFFSTGINAEMINGTDDGTTTVVDIPANEVVANEFVGEETTDLANVPDLTQVDLVLDSGETKVDWVNPVDVSGENLDAAIEIGEGFVSVDDSIIDPTIANAPARITIEGVECPTIIYYSAEVVNSAEEVVAEGQVCDETTVPSCTNIVCEAGVVSFDVTHFSTYGTRTLTNDNMPILTTAAGATLSNSISLNNNLNIGVGAFEYLVVGGGGGGGCPGADNRGGGGGAMGGKTTGYYVLSSASTHLLL